jgi:hypothetical protein
MTTTTHRGSAIFWIAFVVLAGLLALAYCRPFDISKIRACRVLLAKPQITSRPNRPVFHVRQCK